jgi:hypothetical protein
MLVATDTGLDDDGFTNGFTDDRDPELSVLNNSTVCRSARI